MTHRFSFWLGILAFLFGVLSFIPNPFVGSAAFFVSNGFSGIVVAIVGMVLIYTAYKKETEAKIKTLKIIGIISIVAAIICFLFTLSSNIGSFAGLSFNNIDGWLLLIIGLLLLAFSEKEKNSIKDDKSE